MRGDFRALAYDRQIKMRQFSAQVPHAIHRKGDEAGGIRIPPFCLPRRKMPADIAIANGAQYGVRDGVQGYVGVTMARQSRRVRYIDTTQPDRLARLKPMHIETLTDPHIEKPCRMGRIGPGQIFGRGNLKVFRRASRQGHVQTGGPGEGGIIRIGTVPFRILVR